MDWFSQLYRILKLISYGGVSKKLTAQLIGALDHTLTPGGGGGSSDATQVLHSSGDTTDQTTFTADNSGIKQVDVNGVEMLRLWVDGTAGDLLITDKIPDSFISGAGVVNTNTLIGINIAPNTLGNDGNTGIGSNSFPNLGDGQDNTVMGVYAGGAIADGAHNTAIGFNSGPQSDGNHMTFIGENASSALGVTGDVIAISGVAPTNGSAVIGDVNYTDAYFGFNSNDGTSNAILHGKGDAIVFPDSDPHVAGAAYWIAGVLHKSTG